MTSLRAVNRVRHEADSLARSQMSLGELFSFLRGGLAAAHWKEEEIG
jgi:hypothetical protein